RQATTIAPDFAPAHGNLGYILADQGRMAEAAQHYDLALRKNPSPRLRIVAGTMLPPIYESVEEMTHCSERLLANLRQLDEQGVRVDPTVEVFPTLFYLAYQGE